MPPGGRAFGVIEDRRKWDGHDLESAIKIGGRLGLDEVSD